MNKRNKAHFHQLFFLCLLFISGNMNALLRPTKEIAEARARAHLYNINYQLKRKIASLKSNEFFVYEEGTSNGVVVSEDTIIQCKNISNMLYMTLEFGGNITKAVPIPYSFDIIKNVFSILESNKTQDELEKDLNQLTLEQLVIFTNFAVDYLGVAKEKENIFVQALSARILPIKQKLDEIYSNLYQIKALDLEIGFVPRYAINEHIEELKALKKPIASLEEQLSVIPNYNVLRNLTSIPELNKNFYSFNPLFPEVTYEKHWGFAHSRIDESGVIFIGDSRVTIFEFLERMKDLTKNLLAFNKASIDRRVVQLERELEKELGIGERLYRWFAR